MIVQRQGKMFCKAALFAGLASSQVGAGFIEFKPSSKERSKDGALGEEICNEHPE
jgi:hypothetical protein